MREGESLKTNSFSSTQDDDDKQEANDSGSGDLEKPAEVSKASKSPDREKVQTDSSSKDRSSKKVDETKETGSNSREQYHSHPPPPIPSGSKMAQFDQSNLLSCDFKNSSFRFKRPSIIRAPTCGYTNTAHLCESLVDRGYGDARFPRRVFQYQGCDSQRTQRPSTRWRSSKTRSKSI